MLLQRPLFKSLPSLVNPDKAPNLCLEDGPEKKELVPASVQNATDSITKLLAASDNRCDHAKPADTPNNKTNTPEIEKPKLALDIVLCDSTGCLIGSDPGVIESPESGDLPCDLAPVCCKEPETTIGNQQGSPR